MSGAPLNAELAALRAEAAAEIHPASETPAAATPSRHDQVPPNGGAHGETGAESAVRDVAAGVAEWRALLELVLQFAVKAYPRLAEIYAPPTIAQLAGALDAVAAKYGLGGGFGFLEKWKEEIALGVLAWQLVPATLKVIRAAKSAAPAPIDRAELAARAAAAAAEKIADAGSAPSQPAGDVLTPNNDKPYTDAG